MLNRPQVLPQDHISFIRRKRQLNIMNEKRADTTPNADKGKQRGYQSVRGKIKYSHIPVEKRRSRRPSVRRQPNKTLKLWQSEMRNDIRRVPDKATTYDQRIISRGSRVTNSMHVRAGSPNFLFSDIRSGSLAMT